MDPSARENASVETVIEEQSIRAEEAVVIRTRLQRARAIVRMVARRALLLVHRWAEAGWATSAVGLWAFLQSSVLPGPAETLLVPLGLADPPRVWRFAGASTLCSFAGSLVSFAIGHFAFHSVGLPMLALVGIDVADVERSRALFADHGWMLVALSTITPLSLKLTSMAAGAFGVPALLFAFVVFAGRVVRFFAVAAVVYYAGARLSAWLKRRGIRLDERAGDRAA